MKKLLSLTIISTLLCPNLGNAGESTQLKNAYISSKVIYARQKIEDPSVKVSGTKQPEHTRKDNAEGISLALGYNYNPIRVETELTLRNNLDTGGAKIESHTLFANVYYDFKNSTAFTPYIGGGIGLSIIDFKIKNPAFTKSDSSTNFAWNIGIGVGYELCPQNRIDLGYRFADYGTAKFAKDIGGGALLKVHGRQTGNELTLGFRHDF